MRGLLGGHEASDFMPGLVQGLDLTAVRSNCTAFNIDYLKLCPRKEKTKREKRRGRKMAKRMQRRVSLLSGLGTEVAFPDACGGRGPAEGRVLAEICPTWIVPVWLTMCW